MPESAPRNRFATALTACAWLIGMGLAYLWFDDYLTDKRNPNQAPRIVGDGQGRVQIILERNASHSYVVSGWINEAPVTFIVDTGATAVAVPERLGTRLGMPRGREIQVSTANGRARAWVSRIDLLQLGNLQLRDVDAFLTPGLSGDEVLLGMSALRQISFRQDGEQLILEYSTP